MLDGTLLMRDMLIHDNENCGFGGQNILTIGSMGTGKTTLFLLYVQRAAHLDDPGIPKWEYLQQHDLRLQREAELLQKYSPAHVQNMLPPMPCGEIPETVIYAGREFDYWHVFLAKECWPYLRQKPVVLHLPKKDAKTFKFVVSFNGVQHALVVDDIVKVYSSTADLVSHLVEGAINVWYPPLEYALSAEILGSIDTSKFSAKTKAFARREWMNFELLLELMKRGYDRHYTYFVDEIERLLPLRPNAIHWHLCEFYATRIATELRRCQISLVATCHGTELVDHRLIDRAHWLIWTGGAFPKSAKDSTVVPQAIRRCKAGNCIIEERNKRYGRYIYDKIPYQPGKMRVIGG